MRALPAIAAVTVISVAISAMAFAQVKPDRAIHYRQGIYHAILWNFGPMSAVVRGKTKWDQADFAKRAKRIDFYSQQLLEGFPPGSDTGAKTRAKPEIWTHFADFKSKMSHFEDAAAMLAKVSEGGDQAASKQAFMDTAKACRACHDKYREKE